MSRFYILHPSWTSGATATSNSDAAPSVRASNLLTVQPSIKWHSDGLGTLRVTFDAGADRPWQGVYLGYHNASDTGTIKVTSNVSTGALFTTPSYESNPLSLIFEGDLSSFPTRHTWFDSGSIHTHRYIGLEIIDEDNANDHFAAGIFMAGEVFTPRIGADIGSDLDRDDPSQSYVMLNGEEIFRAKRGSDLGNWQFPKQPYSDAMMWKKLRRLYGKHVPMVFKWDAEEPGYDQETIIYGYHRWNGGIKLATSQGHHDVQSGIKEL